MKKHRLRKPSPALVIACMALVMSMAGTGYAASKINGKLIKDKTISGAKLKNDTLSGKQIKESKLGKVPAAGTADNANALGGSTPAEFARNANFQRVFKTMNVGDADVTLVSSGDIGVKMRCYSEAGSDKLAIYATTATDGAMLDSEDGDSHTTSVDALNTDTPVSSSDIGEGLSATTGNLSEDKGYDDTGFVLNAASTHLITLLEGSATKVLNRSGHGCIYAATFIVE